ncbi:CPBP family intramembrane metalloprotease [Gracilibacillus oryzae]|uniref:CPBP family intramembrane metalloprotease n=1 Tax=Gracilibacillus oryzae TaxID=1672701 RepID=A0A7C8KM13_9BACI|nr:type II CAAX endopeptidase family protein [Gracilibacillus oryzae]KAB8125552.1 CPBP family intramembrane metalloprotease [Gracilibacillus oryzae]
MNVEKNLRTTVLARIAIVFIVTCVIWILINTWNSGEYNRLSHFLMGFSISAVIILFIYIVCRLGKTPWTELGFSSFKSNFYAFIFGFIVWLLPALIGTLLLLSFGMVEVEVKSSWQEIISHFFVLGFTVFLIEALPEELIFRGYIFSQLQRVWKDSLVILLQIILFTLFGYVIGAIYSIQQLMFIPGFAFILGYLRAISKNIWVPIGFHLIIMTVTQLLSPLHNHFVVTNFFTLQFVAFILLPSTAGAIILSYRADRRNNIAKNL